jgi:hypothetical protein
MKKRAASAVAWLLAAAGSGMLAYCEYLRVNSKQGGTTSIPVVSAASIAVNPAPDMNDPRNWPAPAGLEFIEGEWNGIHGGPGVLDSGAINYGGTTLLVEKTKSQKKKWVITLYMPKADAGNNEILKCNVIEDDRPGYYATVCNPQISIFFQIRQSPDNRLYLANYDVTLRKR